MGFGWKDALGVSISPFGYGLYKAATGGGKESVTQVPLRTPEQEAAQKGLLDFAKTGTYGGYTAGTPYTGSLGDFGLSSLEGAGLNVLDERLTQGGAGENFLNRLISTDEFDPLKEGGAYDALQGRIDRSIREASDAAKRNAGFAGSLYSTDTIRKLGDVQAKGVETKAATLASLYDNYMGRKTAAAPTFSNIRRQNVSDAFAYGGVPRNLRTAEAQAKYGEFQRQQGEKATQVNALTSLAGMNTPYGVPTVSVPKNNPWMNVMSLLSQFGGRAVGSYLGAA